MREALPADAPLIDTARAALLDDTPESTIGGVLGLADPADGVVDVHFATAMPGYPGWSWSVSLSVLDGADAPSVLELSLLPGEGSLLAPDWVPWADRLADQRGLPDDPEGDPAAEDATTDDDDLDLDLDLDEDDDEDDAIDDLDDADLDEAVDAAGDPVDEDAPDSADLDADDDAIDDLDESDLLDDTDDRLDGVDFEDDDEAPRTQ